MLATVAALCNAAGPITPLLYGRRMQEVRKKLTVLVAMALILAMMLASSGVASAANGSFATGAAHASPTASSGISTAGTRGHNCPEIC
jgi:hypothetical protein